MPSDYTATVPYENPNNASDKEQEAIKLARSLNDDRLSRILHGVLVSVPKEGPNELSGSELRALGAMAFVMARRRND
jgi:hypothetical protein